MMTEQEQNEILLSVRNQLSGYLSKDLFLIQEYVEKYEENAECTFLKNELLHMARNLFPPKMADFLKKIFVSENDCLQEAYMQAIQLTATLRAMMPEEMLIMEQDEPTEEIIFEDEYSVPDSDFVHDMFEKLKKRQDEDSSKIPLSDRKD